MSKVKYIVLIIPFFHASLKEKKWILLTIANTNIPSKKSEK